MSAGDLAAVLVAVVCLAAVAVLVVAVFALVRTMRELRQVVDSLRSQTLPLVGDLQAAVDQAGTELQRVEGILDTAERVADTVDSASRLTFRALSPPLIKTLSFMTGARRAGRRLRGRGSAQPIEAAAADAPANTRHPRRRPRSAGRLGRSSHGGPA
jgi:hypothetical protein